MLVNIELDKKNNRICVTASVTKRANRSRTLEYLDVKGVIAEIKEQKGLVVTRKDLLSSTGNVQNNRDNQLTGEWTFKYVFTKPKPSKRVSLPVKKPAVLNKTEADGETALKEFRPKRIRKTRTKKEVLDTPSD